MIRDPVAYTNKGMFAVDWLSANIQASIKFSSPQLDKPGI